MWAEHLAAAQPVAPAAMPRTRRFHRIVALIFTVTVGANFVAMIWGPPPAWITYAPLLPLLLLMVTGLSIMAARQFALRGKRGGAR